MKRVMQSPEEIAMFEAKTEGRTDGVILSPISNITVMIFKIEGKYFFKAAIVGVLEPPNVLALREILDNDNELKEEIEKCYKPNKELSEDTFKEVLVKLNASNPVH